MDCRWSTDGYILYCWTLDYGLYLVYWLVYTVLLEPGLWTYYILRIRYIPYYWVGLGIKKYGLPVVLWTIKI